MKQETILVGLSGGVDSSVAALRLKNKGHSVVGVFIKVWQPEFLECNWERERLDAMRVAVHLDIPFITFDAVDVYRREVVDYMISEYQNGRTPNPDVMCNQHVKFGAFLDFAKVYGADAIATGHYAQIISQNDKRYLLRGVDRTKDQSYFLWALGKEELSSIYFPIGDTSKDNIRKEAKNAGLPTFNKKDSQGICFLGQIDIKEFLSHYIEVSPGNVLDTDGTVVGTHHGALFYTLGQRHGFALRTAHTRTYPHYIISKDINLNTITVDTKPASVPGQTFTLDCINIIEDTWKGTLDAQYRYGQAPFLVTFTGKGNTRGMLSVLSPVERPSSGQSCVLYRGNHCLGGGIIV